MSDKLRVYSIFRSISGEMGAIPQGMVSTFLRTGLCNLHCHYCDAEKALIKENCTMIDVDILSDFLVRGIDELVFPGNVIITGGEPLIQEKAVNTIIQRLYEDCNERPIIQIETGGALVPNYIKHVDCWVVDYKMPSSGMSNRMPPIEKVVEGFYDRGRVFMKFVCNSANEAVDACKKIRMIEDYLFDHSHYSNAFVYGISPLVTGNPNVDIVVGHQIADVLLNTEDPEHQMFINACSPILNLQLHKIIDRCDDQEEDAIISNLFEIDGTTDVELAMKTLMDQAKEEDNEQEEED